MGAHSQSQEVLVGECDRENGISCSLDLKTVVLLAANLCFL